MYRPGRPIHRSHWLHLLLVGVVFWAQQASWLHGWGHLVEQLGAEPAIGYATLASPSDAYEPGEPGEPGEPADAHAQSCPICLTLLGLTGLPVQALQLPLLAGGPPLRAACAAPGLTPPPHPPFRARAPPERA